MCYTSSGQHYVHGIYFIIILEYHYYFSFLLLDIWLVFHLRAIVINIAMDIIVDAFWLTWKLLLNIYQEGNCYIMYL